MVGIIQINISDKETRKSKYNLNFNDNYLCFNTKAEFNQFKKELDDNCRYKQRGLVAHYTTITDK